MKRKNRTLEFDAVSLQSISNEKLCERKLSIPVGKLEVPNIPGYATEVLDYRPSLTFYPPPVAARYSYLRFMVQHQRSPGLLRVID